MRHHYGDTNFDMSLAKTYDANCHCGAVRYQVTTSPSLETDQEVVNCDCSLCIRHAAWHIYIPKKYVTWIRGEDEMTKYQYLEDYHYFCPICGTNLSISAADPEHEFAGYVSLNARAFKDVEFEKVKVRNVSMKDEDPLYDVDAMPKVK